MMAEMTFSPVDFFAPPHRVMLPSNHSIYSDPLVANFALSPGQLAELIVTSQADQVEAFFLSSTLSIGFLNSLRFELGKLRHKGQIREQ